MESISNAAAYTLRFINQTRRSVFLTGKAGTGKTTLLKEIIRSTYKNTVVVAPTGIAALNAGGVTIHSMFQLPLAGFIPASNVSPQFSLNVKFETRDSLRRHFKMSAVRKAVIRNMELLIIDEVSMLRADLLDAIDFMMQTIRKNSRPFGGVQTLFIGDLLQLPPVVKNEEWETLRHYYKGPFFFHSHVIQRDPPLYIELSKIYRQSDSTFISLLNNLRNNSVSREDVELLNTFVNPEFDLKANKGYITLTTHNAMADQINSQALKDLDATEHSFSAEIVGDFPEKIFPLDETLHLKVGAQIMFVKNDLSVDKNYFNGKTGFITSLSEGEVLVYFPDEQKTIEVERYEWQNIKYYVDDNTKEIREEILGTFVHYPIKLAWAITVHKSQGLTFDKAALDVSRVFAPGQAYVALSRLRSLNGLVLLSPIQMNGISNDADVMEYAESRADVDVLENSLKKETQVYLRDYLSDCFDWKTLAQEWRSHKFSYQQDSDRSIKSKNHAWAKTQAATIEALLDPSRKFAAQLNHLFSGDTIDAGYISDRVGAAQNYFLPTLEKMLYDVLWKLEEVARAKKAKAFYGELLELEELQTSTILKILKAKLLMDLVACGKEVCKENLQSDMILRYRASVLARVQADFERENAVILDDPDFVNQIAKKRKSKTKEPKKSTVQETYELWIQRNTVKEIAGLRKLTTQTIYGHMAKLLEAEAIRLPDLLPEDRIEELKAAFKGHADESLTALKEKHGDKFTWDELRLYKASQKV